MSIKKEIDQLRNGRRLEPFPKWTNPNKPAESLINTTLVMHNKFKTANEKFNKFKINFQHVKSVDDLDKLIFAYNKDEVKFCKEVLDLNIKKLPFWRYHMLKDMVEVFQHQHIDIYEWAKNLNISDIKSDPIFHVKYAKLATIQNLRMCLGIPTLKPDIRVQNALTKLGFKINNNSLKTIKICEEISQQTGYTLYELDLTFKET